MKSLFLFIVGFIFGYIGFSEIYQSLSIAILFTLITRIFTESSKQFVFREWSLLLYCVNYLVAPAITYSLAEEQVTYGMKIPPIEYYELALPGFIFLSLGMFMIPTKMFHIDNKRVNMSTLVNKEFLVKFVFFGIFLRLFGNVLPGELSFIAYLLGLIRFVGAFALFSINSKNWYYVALVLLIELGYSFLEGMYHDALMWLIFFGLYFIYALKPSFRFKVIGAVGLILFILLVQAVKVRYREIAWQEGGSQSLVTAAQVTSQASSYDIVLGDNNLLGTLNRGNQAWIFASTVDNLNRTKKYQGLTIVNKYLEAAILPRFLAPNKLTSGNKEIFNEFSGHTINEGTSMGLGIFADGYIAFGVWGVYIFGFTLGLIFGLTFKLVERWTKVSPFYVLFILPLLSYAVRPDCELQTTINHLSKGILLYGILVYLTRKRFSLDSRDNQRKLLHLNLMK
jgi:hypothetical protein